MSRSPISTRAMPSCATARQLPVNRLNPALEGLRGCLKVAEQLTKATQRLRTLGPEPQADPDAVPGADVPAPAGTGSSEPPAGQAGGA